MKFLGKWWYKFWHPYDEAVTYADTELEYLCCCMKYKRIPF